MTDLVWLIGRVNLVLAAGIVLVLLLRVPARRVFGARIAYGLWLMPLLAATMVFAPARIVHIVLNQPPSTAMAVSNHAPWPLWLLCLWGGGVVLSLVVLALRQLRFTLALGHLAPRDDLGLDVLAAESNTHGPAVIGVLRPMIVTPADFDQRFDAHEQDIVLAHERAHLAQGDPWINAIVLLLQCLNWFNPLVHLGARALRMDQELACDAAVLAQAQGARRRYAETMLKTQLAAAVPIGCAWPPSSLTDLKERIAMLKRNLPSRAQRIAGASTIALATLGACAAAWAAQPARVVAGLAPMPAVVVQPPDTMIQVSADGAALVGDTSTLAGLDDLAGGLDDLAGGLDADSKHDHDRTVIIRREEDLTPEERAEIRAAVDEARRASREAVRAGRDAQRQAMEAQRGARVVNREEIRQAIEQARAAHQLVDSAEIREAIARAQAENRVVVVDGEHNVELREALRSAEIARVQARAVTRTQLSEARAAIAEAEAEARAENDAERADALARARTRLDAAEERNARHRDRGDDSNDDADEDSGED